MIHSANSFVVDETLAEDELLCELCCDLIESDFINDTSLKYLLSKTRSQI